MHFTREFYARRALSSKILKVMRILPLLLTVALVQVRAESSAQVTLDLKNSTLNRAMREISRQTGVYFTYGSSIKSKETKINISITDAPLEIVMSKLLQGTAISWERSEKENTIVLFIPRNTPTTPAAPTDTSIGRTVSGKVFSDKGEPLPGASVRVNGSERGAMTGSQGDFILDGVKDKDYLNVSYTGFISTSEPVGNRKQFQFFLKRSVKALDQVVVQGYGTTTQRTATGSIVTVRAEEIGRQVVMNPLEAIKGRVPGLVITPTSALGTAPFKMELRGRAQISTALPSEPLVIIDDVPVTILEQSGRDYNSGSSGYIQNGFSTPAGGFSPLYDVDPDNIESISVLKDADATAIFGSRGARGVIIIKTKKGRAGQTAVDASVSHGIDYIDQFPELLSTDEYIAMRKEAYKNNNRIPTISDAWDFLAWDNKRNAYWPKVFWGKNGKRTNAQVSISGGDRQTQFRLSGSHAIVQNINSFSGKDTRSSVAANLNTRTNNQKFEASLNAFYTYSKAENLILNGDITLPPTAPDVFKSDGSLNYDGYEPVRYTFRFAKLLQPFVVKNGTLNASSRIAYTPFKGLQVSATMGYATANGQQQSTVPIKSLDPLSNALGKANFGTTTNSRVIIEPMIEYKSSVGIGQLNVMLGGTYQSATQSGNRMAGEGYTNDNLLRSVNNAQSIYITDNGGAYKYISGYSRINYNIKDRYILTLTGRRDGSSRFGPGKRFGNFGSIGAAWVFGDEQFIKNKMPWLSFGKIRASYGTVGSDVIVDYGYQARWIATQPYNGSLSYVPNNLGNPDLKWQVDNKFEVALSLNFIDDRISIEMIYYRNVSKDQLLPSYPLPLTTGFSIISANFPGIVRNTGWEPSIIFKAIKTRNTELSTNFQIGINRNKLVAFPRLEESSYRDDYVVGMPLSIVKLLKYNGVNPANGQYSFEDINKNGTIDLFSINDDRLWKDITPKYDGGFGIDFRFKFVSLNTSWHFRKQIGRDPRINAGFPGVESNQPKEVLQRWQKPGDIAKYPRFTTYGMESDNQFQFSDGSYIDASFLRLNNVALKFDLKKIIKKGLNVKGASLSISGQNMLVITRYSKLSDPELQGFGVMPIPRRIIGQLNVTF